MMSKIYVLLFLLYISLDLSFASKGGWSHWSEWSGWGKGLCSGNQRVKTRSCTNPLPSSNAEYCDGDNAVQQDGPIDGGFSEWSQWSTCERPCGGSVVNRTRECDNPPPSNHGTHCKGHAIETKLECVMPCPDGRVDGAWSPWSHWSSCPSKCSSIGGAIIKRYRQCNMPPPMFGGSACPGNSTEEIWSCFDSCPIHGGFSTWSSFTPCSSSCGSGTKTRSRLCNNPEPRGKNAINCTGSFIDNQYCKLVECVGAIDGHWSNWNKWSQCTESIYCNKGVRRRQRKCDNPSPNKGGDDCEGTTKEVEVCPRKNCHDYRPPPPSILPVDKSHYLYRECGATSKYIATGAGGQQVPQQIYGHIKLYLTKFKAGYFSVQEEEDGKIQKYCFEPYPALKIREAADIVPSYRKTKEIPNYERPNDEDQPVLGFSIRVHKNANYDLKGWDFGINNVLEYIPGNSVHLYDVMFTYYSEGSEWGFLAKGEFRLFNPVIFKSVVFRNRSTEDSAMVGKVSQMKLVGLLNALGIPDDVGGTMGSAIAAIKSLGVWEYEFKPVSIAYDLKHKFKSVFRVTATARVGGIPLHFEILYIHSGYDRKIAFAFTFDGESYGSMLEKMAGASSAGKAVSEFFNAIGLQVELGVMWCPSFFGSFQVTKTTRFHKQPLKDLYKTEVPEGLTAVAQVSIPKDCRGSSFCEITKKIVGPKASFRVAGQVKKGYYKITGGFYKIRITGNYYFHKLELFTEVNTTSSKRVIGFKAEVKIPVNEGLIMVDGIPMENDLKLGGMLKHTMGTSDLTGQLYMKGMWYRAFGLSWLNMGNINLGITITIGSPIPVTGFQFGGQLEFGNNCLYDADFAEAGHCLRVQVYFGYGKPTYFYGRISALTIGKLVRMCGGRMSLPSAVSQSGFPEGLMVQHNPTVKDIDLRSVGGPIVYQGFRLKGALNLFGYKIKTEIKYSPREIYFDGEADPINLGGHLIISRNASHKTVGPKLFFHYKAAIATAKIRLPFFKMYFEGYLKILGIEASAYINITMEQMEMYVYGKVWNLIYAELYVAAGYGWTNIKDAHFYIRVIVDMRGLTDAIEKAKKSVDQAFKYAQQRMRDAIDKVKEAKQRCKEKLKIKCSNCYNLKCKQATENCKGFLDKAGRWIGGVINSAGQWISNTARKIGDGLAKVGRSIKRFFKGWRRRRELLSGRNEHFDIHIRNKRFVSKLICEGIVGGGCKGVSHLCYGTCKAVDFIGQGLCHTLDIAVGALRLTEKTLGWINAAVKFLLEIFLVHGIRFDLGLGQKFNGFMVGAEIDLTIFGKRMYFGFQFDLNNPVRSIMSAKDGSLYRYKAGVRQLRTGTTFNPYDRPNPFADFDLAGTFGIEALSTGTENRLGACLSVPTRNDRVKIELVGCNSTDERQRWTYTLKGSLINMYSRKCLVFPNKYDSELYQRDCAKEERYQMHECDVTTRTLKLRRSNLCASVADTSPNGPGTLTHLGSLKCVHVGQNNKLVLRNGCHKVDIIFEITNAGHMIYKPKDYCVRAVNNDASPGARLELVRPSVGCHKFSFTKLGSIQHINSRLCIQTLNKEMNPRDMTELILGHHCEHTHNKIMNGELADPQMTFAFVPYDNKLKMKDCNDFYDHRGEQRFSIMYEELQSVCSKFAPDLALNKVASQSSIKYNGFPSRAVDGNFNFQWEKGSCMNTAEEMDPWWRVDLGREFIITDVTIINRGDHGDKLKNFQVHVGNSLTVKKNPVCHDRVRQAADGEAIRLQCDPPIPGRFVGVQMYGKGMLSMCEVVVSSRLGGFVDYCQIENGGCQQICYNKCGRSVSCSCLPGYKLAYDGRSCIDINECLINNGGCRTDKKTYCVNYPGGFQCRCPKGYILRDNNLFECMDMNECGVRNGGCEQMCNNKEGGYMCTCRKGYERKPTDPYGCQNINECAIDNGGCSHKCHDYDGGRYCSCQAGFTLMKDGKRCEESLCPVLEAPFYGTVTPNTCVKRFQNIPIGSVCKYECAKGYELTSGKTNEYLTCRIDGTWDSNTPSCHPVKCPLLPRPQNGGLIPSRCHDVNRGYSEYGQRCVAYCKHGYRLRGPPTKYCQGDETWSSGGTSRVECIKVIEPPYLNCPNDIEAVLPSHQDWLVLGSQWQQPQSNMNGSLITVTPKNVGPQYKFSFGKTVVSYIAKSASGDYFSCSFMVNVLDKTSPTVKDCPSDIKMTSNNDRSIISWKEPTFTDNVVIRDVIKPKRKSGDIWHSGEAMLLMYLATDMAGNTKKCTFKVSFKSTVCPVLLSNEMAMVRAYQPNKRYAITCKPAHTLFGNYGLQGSVALCKDGEYFIDQENIGLVTPTCVGYQKSNANDVCTEGSVKFSFDDWFLGKVYYCALCPPGKFYNSSTKSCELCKRGTYQDEQGKLFCETCPVEHSTENDGASLPANCLRYCAPGYFSASGFNSKSQPCTPCATGSYSYLSGSNECLSCPDDATTDSVASTDITQCRKNVVITRTEPAASVRADQFDNVRLECYFTGLPIPKATWTKLNGVLPKIYETEDIYDTELNVIGRAIVIYKLHANEAGTYRCIVGNKNGQVYKDVQIAVIS